MSKLPVSREELADRLLCAVAASTMAAAQDDESVMWEAAGIGAEIILDGADRFTAKQQKDYLLACLGLLTSWCSILLVTISNLSEVDLQIVIQSFTTNVKEQNQDD